MNVVYAPTIPILLREETGLYKQRNNAPEEFRVVVKKVGNDMACDMKEIFAKLKIFLSALGTKLQLNCMTAIQTVLINAIIFMAHGIKITFHQATCNAPKPSASVLRHPH